MNLTYIETKEIPVEELSEHPDSAQPTDAGDRCFITASMPEQGQMQPVTVVLQGDGYKIVDGIGRWQAAKAAGWPTVRCEVMRIRDTRAAALTANGMGRKRSTGASVLSYLMANSAVLLQIERETPSRDGVIGKNKGGRPVKDDPFLEHYSVAAIAKRLGVSDKDVGLAMELMRCHMYGRAPNTGEALDAAGVQQIAETFDSVCRSQTPMRRWKANWGGKRATEGKTKVDNPSVHARRTSASIITMFQNWPAIVWDSADQRGEAEDFLFKAMEILPHFLHSALTGIIIDKWPAHEKKALLNALKGAVK